MLNELIADGTEFEINYAALQSLARSSLRLSA